MKLDPDALYHLAELAEAGIAAASLVHEVRQPIFALRTLAQLGRARRDRGEAPEVSMDEVLELVDHLESVLSAWSDVGRREAPRLYDVREVARGVVQMLEGRRRQVRARLDLVDGAAVFTEGPPSVARQVALNLCLNALDAVEDVDGERVVTLELATPQDQIHLVVRDSGAGIPDAISDSLFDPFVTTKPQDRGTGLGLYVARRLCREHGGDLVVLDSEQGAVLQASFRRTLPSVDP